MTALIFLAIVVAVSVSLAAIMTGAWLAWRGTRNSGWIDTTWTFGLGAVGCAGAFTPSLLTGAMTTRQVLVAVLVAVWSLRLGLHIARRTIGILDDPRYGKVIAEWGADASRQMFFLAQKQALVSIPLALSMVLAAWNPCAGFAPARLARRAGPDSRHRRRRVIGRAAAALPRRSGQPQPDLRYWPVGLVAASELFLRMARLAGLSAARHRSRRPTIHGAGPRSPDRPACIGFWCTSPAFRRWRRICWSAGATNSAPTRRAPMRSSRHRRGPHEERPMRFAQT